MKVTFENFPLDAKNFEGKEVEVVGFWYPKNDREGMLSPYPRIKSCCLQKVENIEKEIFVFGKDFNSFPIDRALTLKGKFMIDPLYNFNNELLQLYVLKDAQLAPIKEMGKEILWCFGIGFFALVLYFTFWARKEAQKNPKID